MERTIGLWGAVVFLVGFVIGVSVFLLPGELAATAGPGVVVSYGIAAVMALFSCVIAAQISAILPLSGAGFVFVTKMTLPFFGFLMGWLVITAVSMAIALVASGFATYFEILIPGTHKTLVAVMIVLAFGVINLYGAAASVRAQSLMVILFMLVLIVFSVVGVATIDGELLVPFFPNGYGVVAAAAIPAFFSYSGFGVIAEIGGEIKNPSRTIPWALFISFLLVLICYSAVSLAIVGHIPWRELAGNDAPVATVAGLLFPAWAITIITVTILAASATSINGLLLGYSRDVYVLSRVTMLPEVFSRLSASHGNPYNSVVLLTGLSVLAVLFGAKISEYATAIVLAIMIAQILMGIALLRLPGGMPEHLQQTGFQLTSFWRVFFGLGLVGFSLMFLIIGVQGSPGSVAALGGILLIGTIYYLQRKRYLQSHDILLENRVMQHIEEDIDQIGTTPIDKEIQPHE